MKELRMPETIYARIVNRKIVEYPVTEEQTINNPDPTVVYYACHFDNEDVVPALNQKIHDVPRLAGDFVYVERTLVNKTIHEMFQYLGETALSIGPGGSVVIDQNLITPEILAAFFETIKQTLQDEMDAFARTRDYDDMGSLCSYFSSSTEKFKKESIRGNYLRDTTWLTISSYFEQVKNFEVPIPMNWATIRAMLPAYTWE